MTEPPREDRLDELLDDPPRGDHHRGRFAGYSAANRVRWIIVGVVMASAVLCVVVYQEYTAHLQRTLAPFKLSVDGPDGPRTRKLHWSNGKARLGLSREAPGVEVILLPDREVRLAPGCDHAQITVDVSDGETVVLEAIVGEIVERPR